MKSTARECARGAAQHESVAVFATTLENAEPSADFRGRLIRIAELSRKVLTFPKSPANRDRTTILTSTLIVICACSPRLLSRRVCGPAIDQAGQPTGDGRRGWSCSAACK